MNANVIESANVNAIANASANAFASVAVDARASANWKRRESDIKNGLGYNYVVAKLKTPAATFSTEKLHLPFSKRLLRKD